MRLKHYLITSHLLVLVSPIIFLAIIFRVNSVYNYQTELKDYLATSLEFSKYERVVEDIDLYTRENPKYYLADLEADGNVIITLYNAQGITLYSTISDNDYMMPLEYLYQDLNQIQYGNMTYTLKRPVFGNDAQVVGFYEISIGRRSLQDAINKNIMVSVIVFISFVIGIFTLVIKYVNRRLNKPINRVIQGMNDYAKGDNKVYVDYVSNDEIGELCAHFNVMKDEIEDSKRTVAEEQKAKEYMIATISHDLKTPLTSIRAYTEMLKLGGIEDSEKCNTYLETILGKCDYMRDMLDDLLTYNLLSMNYQLSLVEVEGEEFCEMLFSGIEATCESKSIQLVTDINVEGCINVDVKYMTRVVDNIVSNAIRHTPVGGHIWLGAFSTNVKLPSWIEEACKEKLTKYPMPGMFIIVKNEGNVISDKDRENLFKPFYQGDEARSKKEHKGVGLGLSISKMIMEKHKGTIDVLPIEHVGNMMVCYLRSAYNKEEQ